MTVLLYGLLFTAALLFALFVSVNFWPLLVLFLWIAVPVWLVCLFVNRTKKNNTKGR